MGMGMAKIIYKEESYKIIGACMRVHAELGLGFLETVYQEALIKEFTNSKIPYQKEVSLDVYYKGEKMNKKYRADFICYDQIILELKAVNMVPKAFYFQTRNYLKATNHRLGILVNFGGKSLSYTRILNNHYK